MREVKWYRWAFVIAWAGVSEIIEPPLGALWGLMLLGILCFLAYTMVDGFKALGRALTRPNVTTNQTTNYNTLNVEDGAIRGTRVDPTAPDEEMRGLVVEHRARK